MCQTVWREDPPCNQLMLMERYHKGRRGVCSSRIATVPIFHPFLEALPGPFPESMRQQSLK